MADGRAASVLAQTAEDEGADLIVVGRHWRGGVAELVLGSVSHERCCRAMSPCCCSSPHGGLSAQPPAPAFGRPRRPDRRSYGSRIDNLLWPGDDWHEVRGLWDLDPAQRHLNHGSYGAAPRPVLEEQAAWIRLAQRNPNRFFRTDLDPALQTVRERAARFLGAKPADLYLLANPTTAILAALRTAGIGPGDRVLVTSGVYPGVVAACAACGAEIQTWDLEAGLGPALKRSGARFAILDHVAYTDGRVLPVERLVAAAHEAGALVCVDGAHAPGALDLNLAGLGADFYAGSFHKWCCAPPGAGFLHTAASVKAAVPGARELEGPPASVEWSGTHDFSALLAVPKAVDLLEQIGLARIRRYQEALLRHASALLGKGLAGRRHPGLLAIPLGAVSGERVQQLRESAAAAGLELAFTQAGAGWAVRVSAFAYNHPDDYLALADWSRRELA